MNIQYSDLPVISYTKNSPSGLVTRKPVSSAMQLVAYEATLAGVEWEVIPDSELMKFTYNNRTVHVLEHYQPTLTVTGDWLCIDKEATRSALAAQSLPIPKGYAILATDSEQSWEEIFNVLQKPVAIKQAKGTHGLGVYLDINTMEEYKAKIRKTFAEYSKAANGKLIVEEMLTGQEYRIIATPDKVVAALYRRPASVVGDGTHTITELIATKNLDPARNWSQDIFPHIPIDEDVHEYLAKSNLTVDSIPAADQHVQLRAQSNVMAGADGFDVTDEMHPSVIELAKKIVRAIPGLPFAGIDFMTTNLSNDQAQEHHGVVEVNATPEFDMHDLPMFGKSRGVAKEFLMLMFPELRE